MNITNNIEFLMKKHNLNNNQLSEKISTTRAAVGNYLKGRYPTLEITINIARYFDVSLDDLVFKDLSKQ